METPPAAANRDGRTRRVHRVPIRGVLIRHLPGLTRLPRGLTRRRAGLTRAAVRTAVEGPIQEAGLLVAVHPRAAAAPPPGVPARMGLPDLPATAGVLDLLTDAINCFSSIQAVFLLGRAA